MDKIVYRNPSKSEVIGRCGVDEKTEWSRKSDKSRTLKKIKIILALVIAWYRLVSEKDVNV